MLLVVDIGNTTTKIAAWNGHSIQAISTARTTESQLLVENISQLLVAAGEQSVASFEVAISSVVPEAEAQWRAWCEREKRPAFFLRGDTPTPLLNRYRTPERLGPDRIAAAVAAKRRFGAPVIVASLGTAVVIDAVSPQSEYLGGAIWVGLATGFAVLAKRTKTLPEATTQPPSNPIGSDTESSIHVGAIYGTASLVEGLTEKLRQTVGASAPLALTGGDAELLSYYLQIEHEIVPELILEGIAAIWEYNR